MQRLWVRFRLLLCCCRLHVRLETDSRTFLFCPVTTKYPNTVKKSHPVRIKAPGSADSSWDSKQSGWSPTVFLNSVIEGKQSFVICCIWILCFIIFSLGQSAFHVRAEAFPDTNSAFDTLGVGLKGCTPLAWRDKLVLLQLMYSSGCRPRWALLETIALTVSDANRSWKGDGTFGCH